MLQPNKSFATARRSSPTFDLMSSFRASVVFASLLTGAFMANALAAGPAMPQSCADLIASRLSGSRYHFVPADAAAWARAHHLNPVLISGDFDGNGRRDWAALMQQEDRVVLAVCLVTRGAPSLHILHTPCPDLVLLARRGTRQYNWDTQRWVRNRRDAIVTSCFEKAAETFVYEKGEFRRFTSAD
jgi:hypothetical protein